MLTAILSALGGVVIGLVSTYSYVELQRLLGHKAADKLRQYANQLEKIITSNNQYLSDWKTANESKKAGIIQSLLSSFGYGPRIDALRAEYRKHIAEDKELTQDITERNTEAATKANNARQLASEADQSITAGIQASTIRDSALDTSGFRYQANSDQNVSAGLTSADSVKANNNMKANNSQGD